jgi:hypothetical protein
MSNLPIHIFLFGLVNLIVEPFCYGCAAFIMTFRFSRSFITKVVAIFCGILFFLWMDDIWPNLGFQQAKMGVAAGNPTVAEIFSGNPSLGNAQFHSGQKSNLFNIFHLGAKDILSACVFVPLGFVIAMLMTRRKWHEVASCTIGANPQPLTYTLSPPPPPPTTPSDDYACRAK